MAYNIRTDKQHGKAVRTLDANGNEAVTGNQTVGGDLSVADDATIASLLTTKGLKLTAQTLAASGAIDADASLVLLNSTTPKIEATIPAPEAGRVLIISQIDGGTAGHTVTLAAGTWDGTNDVATLNAAGETIAVVGVSATRFIVLSNIGSVGFS